jgi:TalC/MipB family fructose-6-phosphate aldolase
MELLLDTINLDEIKRYNKVIALSGVTSNPTIVKKEGKVAFFDHMRQIRNIIGDSATLHAQVVGKTETEMLADAHTIIDKIDSSVFIKVPTNEVGLSVMKTLKQEGINVTATAIYTEFQGYLALAAGADYLAPYYNRMCNMNIDADRVIQALATEIKRTDSNSKILAASFHNVAQVNQAIENGSQAVTMGPDILASGLGMPAINQAVTDFSADWASVYGEGQTVSSLGK